MPSSALVAAAAAVTAGLGAVGGLGGAVLLVPLLVLTGTSAAHAAPLGLLSVAAGSLAAAPQHLRGRLVNHRVGIVLEVGAVTGAVLGALAAGTADEQLLTAMLGVVTIAAAMAGASRKGTRNLPDDSTPRSRLGEWPGSLQGAYLLGGRVVPYRARRVPLGLGLATAAGAVAGLSGVSGGFIKTPTMSEVMHVPVKVAAATTTFTVGLTSASALLVVIAQGRLDAQLAPAVLIGALVGGRVGASLQEGLDPVAARRALSALLIAVGGVLLWRSTGG